HVTCHDASGIANAPWLLKHSGSPYTPYVDSLTRTRYHLVACHHSDIPQVAAMVSPQLSIPTMAEAPYEPAGALTPKASHRALDADEKDDRIVDHPAPSPVYDYTPHTPSKGPSSLAHPGRGAASMSGYGRGGKDPRAGRRPSSSSSHPSQQRRAQPTHVYPSLNAPAASSHDYPLYATPAQYPAYASGYLMSPPTPYPQPPSIHAGYPTLAYPSYPHDSPPSPAYTPL
ncbi:hypothetical protein B0H15DRAFT_1007292, partial [Mycena belliarum]